MNHQLHSIKHNLIAIAHTAALHGLDPIKILESEMNFNKSVESQYDFKSLSPAQHALLQMICLEMTASEISETLGSTVNGAKSRTRYLLTRLLKVHTKKLAVLYYNDKIKSMSEVEYFEVCKIPINWAKTYARIPNSKAKLLDPYFSVVRANYRRPNNIL